MDKSVQDQLDWLNAELDARQNISEKINAWIKEFGSERDALNVAITRLESAEKLITDLTAENKRLDEIATTLSFQVLDVD